MFGLRTRPEYSKAFKKVGISESALISDSLSFRDCLTVRSSDLQNSETLIDLLESVNSEVFSSKCEFENGSGTVLVRLPDWFQRQFKRCVGQIQYKESMGLKALT